MSDRIYTDDDAVSSENFVTVAQAADPGKVLTKRNYKDSQRSYDSVTLFNFFEYNIWSLDELYSLSKRLLDRPRCCMIRARINDLKRRRGVRRIYKDNGDVRPTLILENCFWFALDIDWASEPATGNLVADANTVLLALPRCFENVECFVVASSSYGIKPGIRMRMFFWSRNAVSNQDLKRALVGYETIADPAIFNPIQPIYTAAPIFEGIDDPVKQRIKWITPLGIYASMVDVPAEYQYYKGSAEKRYTKSRIDSIVERSLWRITDLPPGDRHQGLITEGYLLGKMVGQSDLDRNETIERALEACSYWSGSRNVPKDKSTLTWAIDRGIAAMDKETI